MIQSFRELKEELLGGVQQLNQNLTKTPELLQTNLQTINNISEIQLREEAFKARKRIIQTWQRNLNTRKIAYWNSYKTGKEAEQYQQCISKENPLILRKFRPNELPNEQEEEKTVRKNRALQNVKSEIEVLTLKTSRFENKYIKMDENMEKIIRERIDPHLQEELLIIWKKECLKEESKSKNMWLKNDMFKKSNK